MFKDCITLRRLDKSKFAKGLWLSRSDTQASFTRVRPRPNVEFHERLDVCPRPLFPLLSPKNYE